MRSADDQLGLMDHLGIREFFYMGYCIGGCFAGKLLERAPERVIAAVFCQSVGHRPEDRDVMYRHGHENWVPDFRARRPDVTRADITRFALAADFVWSVPFCAIDDTAGPPETTSRFCTGK
jgi:pimeloyl-ACP methyl ester carboxylesterase